MRQIKVDSRFNLCGVELRVDKIGTTAFRYTNDDGGLSGWLPLSGADSLEWIEPEVTFTDEQISELMRMVVLADNFFPSPKEPRMYDWYKKRFRDAFSEWLLEHKAK